MVPNQEEIEMLQLCQQMQAWLDSLEVAGVSTNAALSALLLALSEQALGHYGPQRTSIWLANMADQIDKHGADLLEQKQN